MRKYMGIINVPQHEGDQLSEDDRDALDSTQIVRFTRAFRVSLNITE